MNSFFRLNLMTKLPWCLLTRFAFRVFLFLLALCLPAPLLPAQVVDSSKWSSGSVDLNNDWRTQAGDRLEWAQPGFNDGAWQLANLDELGAAQNGWRWFRLRVRLPHNHMHEHLLVVGGDGVYQAFVNGEAVGDTAIRPWYAVKRPIEEIIPLRDDQDDFALALRTHATETYTIWHLPLFLTVAAGSADAIDGQRVFYESQRLYAAIPSIVINTMVMLAGLGAFALYRSQRGHPEYMWLGLYLFLLGVSNGLLYSSSAGVLALAWNNWLADPLIFLFTIVQIQFTFCFAGRPVSRLWRAYQALLLAPYIPHVLVAVGSMTTSAYVVLEAAVILPAAVLLPILLLIWYRKGNREAGWLIVPSLFPAATSALYDVGSASIFTGWGKLDFLANPLTIGPVPLQVSDLADFLFVLAIGIVMFFRFARVSREQSRVAAELEAAREIQQRLVPAQLPHVPGYALEAAYFPANEVGGDFYQVLEQNDGARLLVVGDVSGKGLKAAMTCTLALGALRTLAEEALGPAAVLTRLNEQLVQTAEGGFITCVCVRLQFNGALIVASAGHLAPYRNGEELSLDQSLPLGITTSATYSDHGLQLHPGDRLTLLSDGVVEARDARGQLFGFERTRAVSGEPANAIARTAQQYGQEDDITVVTVVCGAGPGS
jgi:phosphoserine phosphatase RsbU/P